MASSSCRPLPEVPVTQYWWCLLPGAAPSAVALFTLGHEWQNLSGETGQFFCLQEEATSSSL